MDDFTIIYLPLIAIGITFYVSYKISNSLHNDFYQISKIFHDFKSITKIMFAVCTFLPIILIYLFFEIWMFGILFIWIIPFSAFIFNIVFNKPENKSIYFESLSSRLKDNEEKMFFISTIDEAHKHQKVLIYFIPLANAGLISALYWFLIAGRYNSLLHN